MLDWFLVWDRCFLQMISRFSESPSILTLQVTMFRKMMSISLASLIVSTLSGGFAGWHRALRWKTLSLQHIKLQEHQPPNIQVYLWTTKPQNWINKKEHLQQKNNHFFGLFFLDSDWVSQFWFFGLRFFHHHRFSRTFDSCCCFNEGTSGRPLGGWNLGSLTKKTRNPLVCNWGARVNKIWIMVLLSALCFFWIV